MEFVENDRFFFNARKNIAQMLIDRGFKNNEKLFEIIKYNFEELKTQIDLNKFNLEIVNETDNKIALVSFVIGEARFKKDDLTHLFDYADKLSKEKKKNINIIVAIPKISSVIDKHRIELNNKRKNQEYNIFAELWSLHNLQFNVLENNYVPNHIIISKEDTEFLLKNYNLNHKNQLPKIKNIDPVVKYIGGRIGDVIKIIRKSESTGDSFYYRVVI